MSVSGRLKSETLTRTLTFVLRTESLRAPPRSWCPDCQAFLLGGSHFKGRVCGTCGSLTEGRRLLYGGADFIMSMTK